MGFIGFVLIGVLVVLAIALIGIYNRLVGLRQNVRQGAADIDAQLRQRHDLVPNLQQAPVWIRGVGRKVDAIHLL